MSVQHRFPYRPVSSGSWTLYCTECWLEMKMTRTAVVAPGREMRTYVCGCGHSERITFNIAVAEGRFGAGCTSFQEQ